MDILQELAVNKNDFVRQKVISNPNTPPDLAVQIVKTLDIFYGSIAHNETTSAVILEDLAQTKSAYVSKHVAQNPNTPEETITMLTKDRCVTVRRAGLQTIETIKEKNAHEKSENTSAN